MKKIYFYLLTFLVLTLTSCQTEDLSVNTLGDNNAQSESPYKISLEEALGTAESLLNDISPKTRGKRTACSVDYISVNPKITRAEESDPVFYLVNYENNSGFALLSADRRLTPVYAISDEGHLDLNDTIDNPGLKIVFNNMLASVGTLGVGDGTQNPGGTATLKHTTERMLYKYVRPYLLKISYWHQWEPFNKFCRTYTDGSGATKNSSVGCLALAVGSIMTYHKWPLKRLDGSTIDWESYQKYQESDKGKVDDEWFKSTQTEIARFLHNLGNSSNLDLVYNNDGKGGTGTNNLTTVLTTFVNNKYERPQISSFSHDIAVNAIDSEGPVMVTGNYTGSGEDGAHAWVIDGLIQCATYDLVGDPNFPTEKNLIELENPMYHCVWGWEGTKNNGYYYLIDDKYFDLSQREDTWKFDKGPASYTGKYTSLKIFHNIKPIK